MTDNISANATVNTVLGAIDAADLGIVAVHETLRSVVPGAEYAYDITIDRAEVFETLATKLRAFKAAGGSTLVDAAGMFHGRDVRMYEALSRATGVHIVASTGQGPEAMLGGYFLTPQTNPPTPWPAEKWTAMFTGELVEGMVVPRVERRGVAGLVATTATREGLTSNDESIFRGAGRAAVATGVAVSIRYGADALSDLAVVTSEGLSADRVVVGGLDRADATGVAAQVAAAGAYVGIDHVGTESEGYLSDADRVALVRELIAAGHTDRILLSASTAGVSFGEPDDAARTRIGFDHLLTTFVPALTAAGVSEEDVQQILVANPAALLSVKGN
jgi:predicted metal-dependent phosphotriesterase family hydrolase